MNPLKNRKDHITRMQSFGNPAGAPILFLKDIFQPSLPEEDEFSYLLADYRAHFVYEFKQMFHFQNNTRKTLINDTFEELSNYILSLNRKTIIIANGYSSALAIHLCLLLPHHIRTVFLIDPPVYMDKKISNFAVFFKQFIKWMELAFPEETGYKLSRLIFFKSYINFFRLSYSQTIPIQPNIFLNTENELGPEDYKPHYNLHKKARVFRINSNKKISIKDPWIQTLILRILKELKAERSIIPGSKI